MPDLAAALRAVLPAGVALGHADPATAPPPLPGEGIGPAVPARLAEFAAGRAAARAAMAALGVTPAPVPMGPDRAPVWPLGLTGSITHCTGACLAIVGTTTAWRGLGIDAEPLTPLEPALWPTILGPDESARDGVEVLRAFVAKEAAYKAQYAQSRALFDFHTLRLTWDGPRFAARFTTAVPPFAAGDALRGTVVQAQGLLVAVAAIAS